MHFRVTTLRYRPKEAVPIEPKQQRHISTDGVKTTAGATGQPGAPAPKNKKKPKKRRSIIGMIFSFIGCMLCLCIMAASVGGVLLSMYIVQVTADDAETLDLDNQKNRQTSIVYDINGNEYASLSRNENRIWRELSAMPENLQNAVIAIEDKNFRTEPGINLKGTIGAALNAFTGNRIWGTNRGASTLEQQLIKNLTEDDSASGIEGALRKLRELFGIERLLVCGGGKTDMSFLAAGVLDELSLVLSPTVSGEPETASVFDEMPRSAGGSHVFSLERVERLAGDGLHLVYRVRR